MTDTVDTKTRSEIMRRVHSTNTKPEVQVRSIAHRLGFRFRLHRADLPGKPDIVFPALGKIVFVHGCFWHRHKNCKEATMPASRREYWEMKLERNATRDKRNNSALRKLGWRVLVVWECQLKTPERVESRLKRFLDS
ncbi:MAG: DNA mismatch endonuclease Vsr [Terracidiphilus sp.]|nr:DNA mismatch endonuclease Vsr [Terracidiphilus sp.]